MYIDMSVLIAVMIALVSSILVIIMAIRQNMELNEAYVMLHRKLIIEREARDNSIRN